MESWSDHNESFSTFSSWGEGSCSVFGFSKILSITELYYPRINDAQVPCTLTPLFFFLSESITECWCWRSTDTVERKESHSALAFPRFLSLILTIPSPLPSILHATMLYLSPPLQLFHLWSLEAFIPFGSSASQLALLLWLGLGLWLWWLWLWWRLADLNAGIHPCN